MLSQLNGDCIFSGKKTALDPLLVSQYGIFQNVLTV